MVTGEVAASPHWQYSTHKAFGIPVNYKVRDDSDEVTLGARWPLFDSGLAQKPTRACALWHAGGINE